MFSDLMIRVAPPVAGSEEQTKSFRFLCSIGTFSWVINNIEHKSIIHHLIFFLQSNSLNESYMSLLLTTTFIVFLEFPSTMHWYCPSSWQWRLSKATESSAPLGTTLLLIVILLLVKSVKTPLGFTWYRVLLSCRIAIVCQSPSPWTPQLMVTVDPYCPSAPIKTIPNNLWYRLTS